MDAFSQQTYTISNLPEKNKGYLVPAVIDEYGDTIPSLLLPTVQVFGNTSPPMRQEEHITDWYDVRRTLPYAKMISSIMLET